MAAVQHLVRQYDSLVLHLNAIKSDQLKPPSLRIYDKKGYAKAEEMLNGLMDENLMVLLFLQLDVLSLTSVQSLFYQHSAQSIIGRLFK